jgi:hypothetical protein
MNHVLIYIPSYFDYVRLRNYFRREGLNFVQICEYSKVRSIRTIYVQVSKHQDRCLPNITQCCLGSLFSSLKMEAAGSSKTSVTIHYPAWCHVPQEPNHLIFIIVRTRKLYLSQRSSHWILFHNTEGLERSPMESNVM